MKMQVAVYGVVADVTAMFRSCGGVRSMELRHFQFVDSKLLLLAGGICRACPSFYSQKQGYGLSNLRTKGLVARASENSDDSTQFVAPLQLESPVGQFLVQMLQSHPHLLPAAVDKQLEDFQTERDSKKEETSVSSQNPLYKRIAELKEKEKQKALEEIIYCLIVQRFIDSGITMIPKISETSDPTGRVDFWPNQEMKLEAVHSPEAFEMIESHLALVLGDRVVGPLGSTFQISKIKLGKLYAASIMYGYFLRRVDERFQLERTMKTLPKLPVEEQALPTSPFWDPEDLIRIPADGNDDREGSGESNDGKSYRLRSYVMYLDAETLQRYATIRSKEAFSLIEKQTQALFGRPDIRVLEDGSIDTSNDEIVAVSLSGLTMLVLEAVAFGSFLWDAEGYVESKYHILSS
uniref:UV-B-induced protein n=1 Tax=Kalanchoe fedtschenkoi TaxID=63787 RepID=A0A7N0V525_KALFE